MREIAISIKHFKSDFPELYKQMIKELKFSKGEDIELSDLIFYYSWTILPIYNEEEEDIIEIEYEKHNLKFEDRLNHEVSKISVEVYINYDDYIRGYILGEDEEIPDIIIDDLMDIIVKIMRYEQNYFLNKEVIDSIPNDKELYMEFDSLLTPELMDTEIKECDNLDDILDKINKHGIESLTSKEQNILNNISNK